MARPLFALTCDEDSQVTEDVEEFTRQSCAFRSCLSQVGRSIEQLLAAQERRHQAELAQLRASRASEASDFEEAEQASSEGFPVDALEEAVPLEREHNTDFNEGSQPGLQPNSAVMHSMPSYSYLKSLSSLAPTGLRGSASSASSCADIADIRHRQSSTTIERLTTFAIDALSHLPGSGFFRKVSHQPGSEELKSESILSIRETMGRAKEGSYAVLDLWDTVVSQLVEEVGVRESMTWQIMASSDTGDEEYKQIKPWHDWCFQSLVVRPTSWKRVSWDTFSILVVLYDIAMLPMLIYEFEENNVDKIMFWFTLAFWTQDIVFSFCTGYQVEGKIETRFRAIALRYLKGWFAIDILTVLPDWIMVVLTHGENSKHIFRLSKAAKALRIFRSLRFLRIFRLLRAWHVLHEGLTNQYMISMMEFVKFVLALLLMTHYSACVWYGISKTKGPDGWVQEYELQSANPLYLYLTSMHWATSQLHGSMEVHPGTNLERSFAIFYLVVSLIAVSVFVSSLTNLTLRMQKLHQETFLKTHKLLRYLEQNHISSDLRVRIQSFARHATDVSALMVREVELLKEFPPELITELDQEIKTLALHSSYPLDKVRRMLPDEMRGSFLNVVHQSDVSPGRLLFQHLEVSGKMFILWKGKVIYDASGVSNGSAPMPSFTGMGSEAAVDITKTFSSLKDIKANFTFLHALSDTRNIHVPVEACRCIAEMSLWTTWRHRGQCIISGHPTIFWIDAERFGELLMASQNQSMDFKLNLALFLSKYAAQYIEWMREMDADFVDVLDDLSLRPLRNWKRRKTGF